MVLANNFQFLLLYGTIFFHNVLEFDEYLISTQESKIFEAI